MLQYINLTPHFVVLNDGTVFPESGKIARVKDKSLVDYTCNNQNLENIVGLPPSKSGTFYIVSRMVIVSAGRLRKDLVCPATEHPACKRDICGRVVSVPFLRRL